MKLRELIKEEDEPSLIGMQIGGRVVSPEIHKGTWMGDFDCARRRLTSLYGAPNIVEGTFQCNNNQLTTLKDGPTGIGKNYLCHRNKLETLEGCPIIINGDFVCYSNKIISLKGAPDRINGNFDCSRNLLTSLKDIHELFGQIWGNVIFMQNPIKSHVLGLLLIPGIIRIYSDGEWGDIMNKYIGAGRKGMIDCQNELIEAGLEEYAQI